MTCSNNTKPIDGASTVITLGAIKRDLAFMIGGAIPTNAKLALIHFDMAPAGKTDPIARFTRDINFLLTVAQGTPIQQASIVELTVEQFDALFISVSGDIDAFVEFFEEEA